MADHPYNPNCGCPGCQFILNAEECYRKFGPPPVIGTFIPTVGDVGRDYDGPTAMYRTWMSDYRWFPYFEVVPRQGPPRPAIANGKPLRPPLRPAAA